MDELRKQNAGKNKKDVRPDEKEKGCRKAGVPERKQKSLCPISKKCGGCQLLDMPYSQQLTLKKKQLEEALRESARFNCNWNGTSISSTEIRFCGV